MKTQANPGYLKLVELKNFDPERIDELIKDASICINLVGILFEKKKINLINSYRLTRLVIKKI